MPQTRLRAASAAFSVLLLGLLANCADGPHPAAQADVAREIASAEGPRLDAMRSGMCKDCHPAEYAEHEQSTHGRAFTDEEVRLATARFSHQDCIICHTPRPIFETGVDRKSVV